MSPAAFGAFDRLLAGGLRFSCDMAMRGAVPAGYTTTWRRMPGAVIAGMVEGEATIEIEDAPRWTLSPGTALCVRAGTLHRFSHPIACVVASAHVDFRVFGAIDVLSLIELPAALPGGAASCARLVERCARLAVVRARPHDALTDACAHQAIGFDLLDLLVGSGRLVERGFERLRALERLAPVLAAIEDDAAGITLARLCRLARLSRSRLHALFHEALACAPTAFVRQRRLERACALLVGSGEPIHAIAARAGFGDQFHFSRAFKRVHGMSPSAYRALAQASLL